MTERKGTFKVEFLKEIESSVQERWDQLKIFEEDAPDDGSKGTQEEKLVDLFCFVLQLWFSSIFFVFV